eukprot:TRINITY_DN101_c1_g1_i1.p1 TRINITY_DN101_c1_g1~~TRINITY_DN101_c1_g1_i1.p1  ORF type:complete len:525 (+),score=173.68 TRINITY_DN101_c1_g1_i1:67-1641(+)
MNTTTVTTPTAIKALKVSLNGELRRIPFSSSMSFGELEQRIALLFQLNETSVTLTYVDIDNDVITIGNNEELQIACDECTSSVLRISASAAPVKEVASASAFLAAVKPRVMIATPPATATADEAAGEAAADESDGSDESADDLAFVTRRDIVADFKRKLAELKSRFPMKGKFTPEQRVEFREARDSLVSEKAERLEVLKIASVDLADDSLKKPVSQKKLAMSIRRDFRAKLAELREQYPRGKFTQDQRDAFREAKAALIANRDSLLAEVQERFSVDEAVKAVSTSIDAEPSVKSVRLDFRMKLAALREAYPRGKFSQDERDAFREAKQALVAERDLALAQFPEAENPVKTIKIDFREKLRALQSQYSEDGSKFVRNALSTEDAISFTEAREALVQERNLKLRDLRNARQEGKRNFDDYDADEHEDEHENDLQRWRGRGRHGRHGRGGRWRGRGGHHCFRHHDMDVDEDHYHGQRWRGRHHHHCNKSFQQDPRDWKQQKTARKIANLERKLAYFKQVQQDQLARD